MLALFVLTAVLGLVISNTATVLIVVPIALATAAEAALLTPVQTPGNLMIMAPGGYRFGDYWKLGLPLLVWWLAVSLVVIPAVWPF
jgi:di/tricarboxylate transporter